MGNLAGFEKLPPIKGGVACMTCGCGAVSDLSMSRLIAVGFGSAGYTKNGDILWEESYAEDGFPTVQDVENQAKADPDNDWRIYFHAPLYEAEYQRQGDGVWVLVSDGKGFA